MTVLPISTGSIAVTLLTGDEQAIPAPERDNFIAAGLAHILAVAGCISGSSWGWLSPPRASCFPGMSAFPSVCR
jgi:competence protein ComEC